MLKEKFSRKTSILFASVFLFSFFLYSKTLHFDFVWDDWAVVTYNKNIKTLPSALKTFHNVSDRKFERDYDPSKLTVKNYRPLRTLFHHFIYRFRGDAPTAYHFFNVFLFSLLSAFLFIVLKQLTGNAVLSFGISLIFAAHPVNTEVVCWVKGVEDIMAALFLLGTFYLANLALERKKMQWPFMLTSVLLFCLALLSKLSIIFFPLFFAVYLFIKNYVFDKNRKGIKEFAVRNLSGIILCVILFTAAAGGVLLRVYAVGHLQQGGYFKGDMLSTLLCMPRVFLRYLQLEIIPFGYCADYSGLQLSLEEAGSINNLLASAIFFIFFIASTIILFRYKKVYGWLWFWLALIPFSNIIPMVQMGADRFLFISTLGFAWMLAEILKPLSARKYFLQILLIVVLILSILTFMRSSVWENEKSLWKDTVSITPEAERPLHNLAKAYFAGETPEEGLVYAEKLCSLYPSRKNYDLLAVILCLSGREDQGISIIRKTGSYHLLKVVAAKAAQSGNLKLAEKCIIIFKSIKK